MKTKNITPMKRPFHLQRVTSASLAVCAMLLFLTCATFAAPRETDPIWRVQLRVQTADVEDAGTDDSVRMALNLNNNTWLDYGRDDFPRNNTFDYDLKLDNVATIADLSHIYLAKTGSDGLCLKSVALLVNGRLIYDRVFPGYGLWLDNSGGHSNTFVVNYTQLRQDNAWQAYTQPFPPFLIPRLELENRIEGLVGDFITGNKLYWGHLYGRAVQVTQKRDASNTLRVDLDLAYDVFGFDPEVDVDFDLEVRCVNNRLTLLVKNVKVVVDSSWYAEIFTLGIYQLVDYIANKELSQALKGITVSQSLGVPFCPIITVHNDGSISFSLPSHAQFTNSLALAEQASAEEAASNPTSLTSAEETAPLTVAVETADSFHADAGTPYTLLVKTNRQEGSQINVQIALPAGVNAGGASIEVQDANGPRTIPALFSTNEQGQTVLSFQDWLAAGAEQQYRLQLRFPLLPQAELQIVATASDEAGLSLKSMTFFQLAEGAVKQQGTIQAVKGGATKKAMIEKQ